MKARSTGNLGTVHVGHLVIRDHRLEGLPRQRVDRVSTRSERGHLVPVCSKQPGQGVYGRRIIIDDEDLGHDPLEATPVPLRFERKDAPLRNIARSRRAHTQGLHPASVAEPGNG